MGLSMAAALQTIVFILILGIPTHDCAMIVQDGKCVYEKPCFDLTLMANMAERVSKDVTAEDGEKILLRHNSFDKIKGKKNLHSCVLQRIIDLFQDVLMRTEGKSSVHHTENMNYHQELIHIMDQLRKCVYKVKDKCNNIKKQYKTTTFPTMVSESDMNVNQLAALQLQKLKYARDRLDDLHIQERVMDELKTLHLYMQGKGFRKKTND